MTWEIPVQTRQRISPPQKNPKTTKQKQKKQEGGQNIMIRKDQVSEHTVHNCNVWQDFTMNGCSLNVYIFESQEVNQKWNG